MLNWNSRSILPKQLEYFEFLNRNKVDVAAVTETWLKPTNSFNHPDYYCLRMDRNRENVDRGGGVMLSVRKGLVFQQINVNTKLIESVGINVISNDIRIKIVAVYFPGTKRNSDWQRYRNDLRFLMQDDIPTFLVGDFNARSRQWNCSKNNKAGTQLIQVITANNFFVHAPVLPTFHPTGRGQASTLDLVLSNNLVDMSIPRVSNDLSSDHLPVSFEIAAKPNHIDTAVSTMYNYHRADWPKFQRVMNESLDLSAPIITELNDSDAVDTAIQFFSDVILRAENLAVPKMPIRTYSVPEISLHTKNLITLRNRRRRQWIRTRDPFYKCIVESLNNRIRQECAQTRFQKFGSALSSMESSDNNMWKITRALRKTCKYSPPLRNDGTIVSSPQMKANLLAENFAKAHDNTLESDAATIAAVENSIAMINEAPSISETFLVRPKEIKLLLKNLKNKKAPGGDKIGNQLLKHLPRRSIIVLARIFSACLRLCYFPKNWKHALITAIPKPGKDITNPVNYRPISLLPTMSKLLERIILVRLEQHLQTAQIIPDQQFGFKQGHSTNHQLVRLVKAIKTGFGMKKSSGMVSLDIEKAYDSVWQDAILHKMVVADFPIRLVKIVQSFLKHRSFQVTVNGTFSEKKTIPYGVPQGSVLSPTLYV